jgi:WD repeat-containing protein 26
VGCRGIHNRFAILPLLLLTHCIYQSGQCFFTINHREPPSSAVWVPDGESFVISSLDSQTPLCHWSVHGSTLFSWPDIYKAQGCAISPDGKRLIAISTGKEIYVYNFQTRLKEYTMSLKMSLPCISISRDSRYMLVDAANGEILLVDIETADVVRRYLG